MDKHKGKSKKHEAYTCKTCGTISTFKKRICVPEKISFVKSK